MRDLFALEVAHSVLAVVNGLAELPKTHVALIRSLARMLSHMHHHCGLLARLVVAFVALEGILFRVYPVNMAFEVDFLAETFLAHGAVAESISVYSFYVL